MPFDPTLPLTNSEITSAELREQFTGLKDLIDAIPAPPAETDPVFTASEAALLVPGDKAKIDTALQPGANVSALVNDAEFLPAPSGTITVTAITATEPTNPVECPSGLSGAGLSPLSCQFGLDAGGHPITSVDTPGNDSDADTMGARNAAITEAVAFVSTAPGHWAGSPPATLAEAINRWAAFASNNGANPIP